MFLFVVMIEQVNTRFCFRLGKSSIYSQKVLENVPGIKPYPLPLFSSGLKYSESVAKMLNMTQDAGRQLSTARNTEAVAKFSEIVIIDHT
jgi:hypothetical protein